MKNKKINPLQKEKEKLINKQKTKGLTKIDKTYLYGKVDGIEFAEQFFNKENNTRKIDIKQDRKKIADIISLNLSMMVIEKNKNNKKIVINSSMVQNVADCIIAELLGLLDDERTQNPKRVRKRS